MSPGLAVGSFPVICREGASRPPAGCSGVLDSCSREGPQGIGRTRNQDLVAAGSKGPAVVIPAGLRSTLNMRGPLGSDGPSSSDGRRVGFQGQPSRRFVNVAAWPPLVHPPCTSTVNPIDSSRGRSRTPNRAPGVQKASGIVDSMSSSIRDCPQASSILAVAA